MAKFIGFYDKNGHKLYEGDLIIAPRYYSGKHKKLKTIPKQIDVIFEIKWSDRRPEYYFNEIKVIEKHKYYEENNLYRYYPNFEAFPRGIFWRDKDGEMANQWHFDKIKHIKGNKKYKVLWEVEKYKEEIK